MNNQSISIPENYWDNFKLNSKDTDFLYNSLLEQEIPLSTLELTEALIGHRIEQEKKKLFSIQQGESKFYSPKNKYPVGKEITFPAFEMLTAKVISTRPGINPEYPGLEVIEVQFPDQTKMHFASNIQKHILNEPTPINMSHPNLSVGLVVKKFGKYIGKELYEELESNPDLVMIAGKWFPRSLLVDVNIGHLNLAEAVLEVENGGPLSTKAILDQIELPTDVNLKLTEFSLNLALQEDGRFDEVGPAGETLWYLKRLEPDTVKSVPNYLIPNFPEYDFKVLKPLLAQIECVVMDELEPEDESLNENEFVTFSLIYPHWRAGTIPLTTNIAKFFPTAYEAPRVRFDFVNSENDKRFPGWVVRSNKYVYGLETWYKEVGAVPGSLITLLKGMKPGEVIVKIDRRKPSRDWLRTMLIGTDGGFVFAMLKQPFTTSFDERMTIVIPDPSLVDRYWEPGWKSRYSFEDLIKLTVKELSKLNPQGHVHLEELYAAVNFIRRCPPSAILYTLMASQWANHLGDLYFKLTEETEG